ncbi:hypothetical protein PF004_g2426 [Phytophthora fragariae]|uniref:Kinesin motor domain-containing protein n=1 Tax=Phytophthora fragariae TaxID=53985 RepID=A0A6G0PPI7_9STRA|nr:hypothetical protein PF004_g2426 [Phytophthora fragariae]
MPSSVEASGPLSLSPAPSPTSSTSSTSSLDLLLAAEDPSPLLPPPQMTAHRVVFGRNVIQVPLKQSTTSEYVNLVLSQLEFDAMAVHVPQYEALPPEELLERITQLLKEQETKRRQRAGSSGDQQAGDSLAAFQSRLLELEYERKRLHTKLRGAKALQLSLTDENTTLRVQLEQQAVDVEELLRYQTLHLGGDVAKWKNVAKQALRQLGVVKDELKQVKEQVKGGWDEAAATVEDAVDMVVQEVDRREHVLQLSYLAEKKERETMAEKYYELSGRIRVFCRLRPGKEVDAPALVMPRPNNLLIAGSGKEFAFDQVFGPQSTQADVYAQIEPLVVSFTDGYNACIMAYGQTGSGKTHTMVGNDHGALEHRANGLTVHANAGVIPRALQQVFAVVNKRQMTYVDAIRVSMVEIYNDQILDLLHEDSCGAGKNAVAKNETDITARDVSSYAQVDAVMRDGNANRNIAATKMNLERQAKTLMMLQLSPDTIDVEETTCSLQFGARVSQVQMGAVRPSVESGALFKLQEENRTLEAKTLAMETQVSDLQRQCQQQGNELREAQSSKEALERQLWLLGGRQRGDKAPAELDHDESPPEDRTIGTSQSSTNRSASNTRISATECATDSSVSITAGINDISNPKSGHPYLCYVSTSPPRIDARA